MGRIHELKAFFFERSLGIPEVPRSIVKVLYEENSKEVIANKEDNEKLRGKKGAEKAMETHKVNILNAFIFNKDIIAGWRQNILIHETQTKTIARELNWKDLICFYFSWLVDRRRKKYGSLIP